MSGPVPPPQDAVLAHVRRALAEDLGSGDVTAALLPDVPERAYLLCKEDAVIAGRPWFDACHRELDPRVQIHWQVAEGERVAAGTVLALLEGRSRALVSAERSALNFLQTLSGTATTTAAHVEAVRGTGAMILDQDRRVGGPVFEVDVGGVDDERGAAAVVAVAAVDVAAHDAIERAPRRFPREGRLERADVRHLILDLVLQELRQRPIRQPQARPQAVEVPV